MEQINNNDNNNRKNAKENNAIRQAYAWTVNESFSWAEKMWAKRFEPETDR
jgi:hypothetical protein